MNKQRGFTLIELLVVIAIIGLLSSIVMASLNSAREKARDTSRKQSLIQLRNALEMYYADNGHYPITSAWRSSEPNDPDYSDFDFEEGFIPGLAPTYISQLPRDPRGGDSKINDSGEVCRAEPPSQKSAFLYKTDDEGKRYKLLSHCAPEGTINTNDSFFDQQRPDWAWQVCSDETACAW